VHYEHVAVRLSRNTLADASVQQPVEERPLVRADHDEIGAATLGQRHDRVRGLTHLDVEVGGRVVPLKQLARVRELGAVDVGRIDGVERSDAVRRSAARKQRRDARV
jgi:hypothetical protein